MIGGACADVDQIVCREAGESFCSDVLSTKIAADQSGVSLTYFDEELAGLMVGNARDVEAFVFIAVAQDWDVHVRQDDRISELINAFDDC
jgi:hypothetical protein